MVSTRSATKPARPTGRIVRHQILWAGPNIDVTESVKLSKPPRRKQLLWHLAPVAGIKRLLTMKKSRDKSWKQISGAINNLARARGRSKPTRAQELRALVPSVTTMPVADQVHLPRFAFENWTQGPRCDPSRQLQAQWHYLATLLLPNGFVPLIRLSAAARRALVREEGRAREEKKPFDKAAKIKLPTWHVDFGVAYRGGWGERTVRELVEAGEEDDGRDEVVEVLEVERERWEELLAVAGGEMEVKEKKVAETAVKAVREVVGELSDYELTDILLLSPEMEVSEEESEEGSG